MRRRTCLNPAAAPSFVQPQPVKTAILLSAGDWNGQSFPRLKVCCAFPSLPHTHTFTLVARQRSFPFMQILRQINRVIYLANNRKVRQSKDVHVYSFQRTNEVRASVGLCTINTH